MNTHEVDFAKNTSLGRIFGENSSKISAGKGILGKDEGTQHQDPGDGGHLGVKLTEKTSKMFGWW